MVLGWPCEDNETTPLLLLTPPPTTTPVTTKLSPQPELVRACRLDSQPAIQPFNQPPNHPRTSSHSVSHPTTSVHPVNNSIINQLQQSMNPLNNHPPCHFIYPVRNSQVILFGHYIHQVTYSKEASQRASQ